jgi:tetratricopeptide (TPR) repeat protein
VAGNSARALDLLQEAIRVVRLHRAPDDLQIALLRANMGNRLMEFSDYEGARATYTSVLPIFESHYGLQHSRTTAVKVSLGIASAGVGDTAAALRYLREAETTLAARPGPPDPSLAITLR